MSKECEELLKDIKNVVDNKPKVYVVSVKYNPELKTNEKVIKLESIVIQEEEIAVAIKRFMLFFKKKSKRVSREVKEIKVKDLNVGDIICVLEYKYPDRYVSIDRMLVSLSSDLGDSKNE